MRQHYLLHYTEWIKTTKEASQRTREEIEDDDVAAASRCSTNLALHRVSVSTALRTDSDHTSLPTAAHYRR